MSDKSISHFLVTNHFKMPDATLISQRNSNNEMIIDNNNSDKAIGKAILHLSAEQDEYV